MAFLFSDSKVRKKNDHQKKDSTGCLVGLLNRKMRLRTGREFLGVAEEIGFPSLSGGVAEPSTDGEAGVVVSNNLNVF